MTVLALEVEVRWGDELIAFHRDIPAALRSLAELGFEGCAVGRSRFGFVLHVADPKLGAQKARSSEPDEQARAEHAGVFDRELTIELGDRVVLSSGTLTARFTCVASPVERFDRGGARVGSLGHVAVVAALHAVLLTVGASAHANDATSVEAERAQAQQLQAIIARAEEPSRARDMITLDADGEGESARVNDRRGDGRAGGGAAHTGKPGAKGKLDARSPEPRRFASQGEIDAAVRAAREDARSFGIASMIGEMGEVTAAHAFGDDRPASFDGAMFSNAIGESGGFEGLGLSGIGEGGGSHSGGIGLNSLGGIGHTYGPSGDATGGVGTHIRTWDGQAWSSGDYGTIPGRLGSRAPRPRIRVGAVDVRGALPREVVLRIVRQNFGRFRICYENGLRANPKLEGHVTTRFVINHAGEVASFDFADHTLPDLNAARCVLRSFSGLSFPQPEEGAVIVRFQVLFAPGD